MAQFDKDHVVGVLNRLLEAELAGVVRYTRYSFLVLGFARIPDKMLRRPGDLNAAVQRAKSP